MSFKYLILLTIIIYNHIHRKNLHGLRSPGAAILVNNTHEKHVEILCPRFRCRRTTTQQLRNSRAAVGAWQASSSWLQHFSQQPLTTKVANNHLVPQDEHYPERIFHLGYRYCICTYSILLGSGSSYEGCQRASGPYDAPSGRIYVIVVYCTFF